MTRTTKRVVVFATIAALGLIYLARRSAIDAEKGTPIAAMVSPASPPQKTKENEPTRPPAQPQAGSRVLSAEKQARLEQIRRDYGEMRAKMSEEYGAVGEKFPGGVSAFLRQLALLEREMHADFAKALTPQELEDYELQTSNTGKTVQQRAADLALSDDRLRAVYRVQREFDDRFALVFDMSAPALLERTQVQLVAREKIRAILGDETFAKWLRTEDPAYHAMGEVAQQRGLPAGAAIELGRIKDDWTLRKLEIAARSDLPVEQRQAMHTALAEQIRSRVMALVGGDGLQLSNEAFAWLPPAP